MREQRQMIWYDDRCGTQVEVNYVRHSLGGNWHETDDLHHYLDKTNATGSLLHMTKSTLRFVGCKMAKA